MKSKKIYVGLAALTLILAAGITSVSAYQGDYTQEGPNCTPERHDAMELSFDNNDYNAWQSLMADKGRVADVVNQDNFAKFAEAHVLGKSGDVVGADSIRTELGLRTNNGEKMGAGYGKGNGKGSMKGQGQGQGSQGVK